MMVAGFLVWATLAGGAAAASRSTEFEFRVVGPDGKAIGNASVELHANPAVRAEQVRRGSFVKAVGTQTSVSTDGDGRLGLLLEPPEAPTHLNIFVTIPGFGPYWAAWSSDLEGDAIPARFTAKLEKGWSVGGVVVDDRGKPVAGARVHPGIACKGRPG